MYIDLSNMTVERRKTAGLLSIGFEAFDWDITLHFAVYKKFRIWGREDGLYDVPLIDFGLGPLFLACAIWSRK